MEAIGIICEYNPFHNGHIYHIKKIKELYPDAIIILVLNGYFLERGEISYLSKEAKTQIALEENIDIVLELPTLYGTQSADTFAKYALTILNNFHISKLIFGSECNDIQLLLQIVNMQQNTQYQEEVKSYLNQGFNYPTALAKATNISFSFSPNDLLGISYISQIKQNNYPITPITIKRTNSYHDTISNNTIISASNIRNKLKHKEDIKKYLPALSSKLLKEPNHQLYFYLLKTKILTDKHLNEYLDVDEGIEYRLQKYIKKANTLEEFLKLIKTKRYTYNRLNRMFIHILLSIPKNYSQELRYTKILGFNTKGQQYLKQIKTTIPTTPDINSLEYKTELNASIIYDILTHTNSYNYEKQKKPIIKH